MKILECLEYGSGSCRNESMIEELMAERNAARAELAAVIVDYQDRLAGAFIDTGAVVMERDAASAEVAELREELAALRAIAQNALDRGGDVELVYAPLYQQALEDIASEEQDDSDSHVAP